MAFPSTQVVLKSVPVTLSRRTTKRCSKSWRASGQTFTLIAFVVGVYGATLLVGGLNVMTPLGATTSTPGLHFRPTTAFAGSDVSPSKGNTSKLYLTVTVDA